MVRPHLTTESGLIRGGQGTIAVHCFAESVGKPEKVRNTAGSNGHRIATMVFKFKSVGVDQLISKDTYQASL